MDSSYYNAIQKGRTLILYEKPLTRSLYSRDLITLSQSVVFTHHRFNYNLDLILRISSS